MAHYLLRDTSSGQMNSEQSLVAGTRSHGKFSCHIVIKLYCVLTRPVALS